jgi:pimeloyl-ACP methyl ester carboxylesterase
MHQERSLPDGRKLGFSIVGEGTPVLYFHGTASSRLETLLLKQFASAYKFQIIGVDRPGYGLSTFAPRKNLRDFTNDLNYLINHLGIEKTALLAWSGGGPFALTYSALFPKNVTKAVIAGSPALPFDVATAHNNSFARYAMKIPFISTIALKRLRTQVLRANKDIGAFLRSKDGRRMLNAWPREDARFFADLSWLALMYQSMAEAFRQNNDGVKAVFQEHQLFMKPWAEPISLIPSGKVTVWHGIEDTACRVENAHRIGKAVPNAIVEIFKGEGHCVMFDNLLKLRKILRSE